MIVSPEDDGNNVYDLVPMPMPVDSRSPQHARAGRRPAAEAVNHDGDDDDDDNASVESFAYSRQRLARRSLIATVLVGLSSKYSLLGRVVFTV
jgi:hypothetical protein